MAVVEMLMAFLSVLDVVRFDEEGTAAVPAVKTRLVRLAAAYFQRPYR